MLEETRVYVRKLHAGHLDQLGRPYHQHLERVLDHLVRLFPDATQDMRLAALLHGCVEEKKTTLDTLRAAGYSENVIEMVAWNTRPRGTGAPAYLDWIQRLADHAPIAAIKIKIADNEDNNDPRRIAMLPPQQRNVGDFYARARIILDRALERRNLMDAHRC
jgi:(p)ppGpp synthase/HD superfamily hydrolase